MASESVPNEVFRLPLEKLAAALELGDLRRERRVLKMAEDCLPSAGCSLPALFGAGGRKDEKAAQVLLSNDGVDVLDLRDALYALSLGQVEERGLKSVVSAFDPTLLDFSAQEQKVGRMPIGNGDGRGYQWLNCALLDPESGHFLGVAHQALISSDGPDDRHVVEYAPGIKKKRIRKALAKNPQNQFLTHARAVDRRVPTGIEVIHIADREFDDGLALRSFFEEGRNRFIVRATDKRIVQAHEASWLPRANHRQPSPYELAASEPGVVNVALPDLISRIPAASHREIPLDSRGRLCPTAERTARVAKVTVGAVAVRIARQSKRGKWAHIEEKPVWLNIVVVREPDPPPGAKRLQWVLLTDLSITTATEIARVVELYSCRWRIEEFFRTVKDAMKLERSKLDDPASTARLIFFATLKAMLLDHLRAWAEIPAGAPPTSEQCRDLRTAPERVQEIEQARLRGVAVPALTRRERGRLALGLIARHGRWSTVYGTLGNYVLLRGLPLFVLELRVGRYPWLLQDPG